ncbi:MAG: OmpA family protein, partial [Pseudomonadota bacterium]
EVLFAAGSAELGSAGQEELRTLGAVLREVGDETSGGLNWILRVDGHTDRIPIRNSARFADNWELSQARALSVVKFLVEQEGVPPARLAATGFGEFQPLVVSDDPAEFARNRRIEFKFTER